MDFYANLGYPSDSSCNIFFDVFYSPDNDGKYISYDYQKVNYQNIIDSVMDLYPHKLYTFYLPLFQIYGITNRGKYRIQGFYRFRKDDGSYYVQPSDYLYLNITKEQPRVSRIKVSNR